MKVLLELLDLILVTGIATGGAVWVWRKMPKKAKGPKYRCPWTPCGYPLPDSPLVEKPETHTHYATYAEEECPGCGQLVKFNDYNDRYERIVPKKGKNK